MKDYPSNPEKDFISARCPACDWGGNGGAYAVELLEKGFKSFECSRYKDYDEKIKRMVYKTCGQKFDLAISMEQAEKLKYRIEKYKEYKRLEQELISLEDFAREPERLEAPK